MNSETTVLSETLSIEEKMQVNHQHPSFIQSSWSRMFQVQTRQQRMKLKRAYCLFQTCRVFICLCVCTDVSGWRRKERFVTQSDKPLHSSLHSSLQETLRGFLFSDPYQHSKRLNESLWVTGFVQKFRSSRGESLLLRLWGHGSPSWSRFCLPERSLGLEFLFEVDNWMEQEGSDIRIMKGRARSQL